MKKTLTIMMTAATALLGLSACNDSDRNNSSSPAAPISVNDFANGTKYYEVTSGEVEFTLSAWEQASADGSQQTVTIDNLLMNINGSPFLASGATYTVDGATATITGISSWTNSAVNDDFCKAWGLSPNKDEKAPYVLGNNASFSIRIAGGMATLMVDISDADATVTAPESPVSYPVSVQTDQSSNPGGSSGDGSTSTSTDN